MRRHTLLILLTGWVSVAACAQESVFPGEEWEVVKASDFGWDEDALQGVTTFARDSSNTTGLMVVDRGRVVLEYGDLDELSYLASVRKSILAMLYGNYIADGTIVLERSLAELGMDDIDGLSDGERSATVRDLIAARSGVYHAASNAGDNSSEAPPRDSQAPGSYYLYNNWDFNAAGHAFETMTGKNIYDALGQDLAAPLGFQDWDREAQQKSGDTRRSRYQAYHIWLSTRDMARVGYLMLNEGEWNGSQVIPAEWSREIRSVVTPIAEMNPPWRRSAEFGYGYMWWVWDGPEAMGAFEGAYSALGAYGQFITVLPAVGLVIAHKTKAEYRRRTGWGTYRRIVQQVLDARPQDH